nr:hypothetical protein [Trentepohlia sp. YN1317]
MYSTSLTRREDERSTQKGLKNNIGVKTTETSSTTQQFLSQESLIKDIGNYIKQIKNRETALKTLIIKTDTLLKPLDINSFSPDVSKINHFFFFDKNFYIKKKKKSQQSLTELLSTWSLFNLILKNPLLTTYQEISESKSQ